MISLHGARGFPFIEPKILEIEASLMKEGDGLPQEAEDCKHEHILKLEIPKAYICDFYKRHGTFWAFPRGCSSKEAVEGDQRRQREAATRGGDEQRRRAAAMSGGDDRPAGRRRQQANEPKKNENKQLDRIIEHPDGDVELRFSNNRVTRLKSLSSRFSTSDIPTSSYEKDSVIGTKFTKDEVCQPIYKIEIPNSSQSKTPNSPTASDMGYSEDYGINVLSKLEKEFSFSGKLEQEFYSP
ncbi:hypothetical protein Ccrd_002938 [Cynara cardunculus var. scolymus]|uniref:Uncharacterized protein n=1 Tax=Cynara cardunculus var. scolymus TaxID=59895 RepID=A0A118JWV8_CYNCS|nr:hypothetical protein Ccrd_002938 [Cynara cardunculus var. scolymus]